MSKYIPPRSRKSQQVSDPDSEKRLQRQLRFSKEGSNKNEQNRRTFSNKGVPDRGSVPQYGFVSRGEDSRLQNSEQAQQEYFEWILQTFEGSRRLCGDNIEDNGGKARDAVGGDGKGSVQVGDTEQKGSEKVHQKKEKNATTGKNSKGSVYSKANDGSLDSTLASLRKLREAMLHQKPTTFSVKVHLFSVRISAPIDHYQTYIPSINYLLASGLLTDDEMEEIATLLVLHVSHCNHQDAQAFRIFDQHLLRDKNSHLYSVLVAWTTGDYHNWVAKFNGECDHCVHAIMARGLPKMMAHMVVCMTKSYFTLSVQDFKEEFLPKGMGVGEFIEKYALQWKEEDGKVVIRQRR